MKVTSTVAAASFKVVCDGPVGTVRLAPHVYDAYLQAIEGNDEISVRRKTHLTRYFEAFCSVPHVHTYLNDEKFKKEENFGTRQGIVVPVWAFKAWQLRVYGAVFEVKGKRCFVGTEIELSKKKDKANRAKLKTAAQAVADLADFPRK